MNLLLLLYPRRWRTQYGAEMEALLLQMSCRGRLTLSLDLLRGAADAHLHPQWPHRRRLRRLGIVLGVLAAALASHAVAVALGAVDAHALTPAGGAHGTTYLAGGQIVAAWVLAGLWLLAAPAWRWLGSRTIGLFCVLMAVRFAADWYLAGLAGRLLPEGSAGTPLLLATSGVEVALWGGVAVLALRRSRLAWPGAFAAGCLLELALGSTGTSVAAILQHSILATPRGIAGRWDWSYVPGYLEPLRIATWAALLAWLGSRRRPRPGTEPPEGAPVAARPSPDAPELLAARARRAS